MDATPVITPNVRITELLIRHELGPQDSDSDDEDGPDPSEENFVQKGILSAAKQRWQPIPTPPRPSPNTALPPNANTKTHKKNLKHRRARHEKREIMRADAPEAKAPKAVTRVRRRQTTPLSLPDLHFSKIPLPVASTGWMGLRNPPELPLEPEIRVYTLAEARAIPGMQYVDWNGCVSLLFILIFYSCYLKRTRPVGRCRSLCVCPPCRQTSR